jgi:Heparinase II/III-like protein/Heparinase II/III N-terminus
MQEPFDDANTLDRKSGVNLRNLANAVRNESLPALMSEVGWRGIRSMRKSIFKLAGPDGDCPVIFQPIGYYRLQRDFVSGASRKAILAYADAILRGEYPLMGYGAPHLGASPDWHCDWVSGKSWPIEESERMRIVRHDGSDVKAPWELSRLQFAPVVAKAYVLNGDGTYREALRSLLTDWIERNPIGRGVNWTVAMEAALRGISLCLTMELLWPFSREEKPWLDQMTASLWQHLRFIETNSEFSFLVRSNHYLSNIVGLTTLSAYLQGPGMLRRRQRYARAVNREILLQTYPDGGDCEASTGYHVLVAQMFLHSFVVQQRSGCVIASEFETRLRLMFVWIASLANGAWELPHLGDCDNGRVELLCDDIAQTTLPAAERHSLRVGSLCGLASYLLQIPSESKQEDAVWFGLTRAAHAGKPEQKPVFVMPDSGLAVLRSGDASVIFCAMPNGLRGKGSHTHCDKLSIIFRLGPNEVFCDSGSRCYTRSAELRNLDRSTRAHNTAMVDGTDQNIVPGDPGLLFQCGNEAIVSRIALSESEEMTVRASHQGYSRFGIEHHRVVQLTRPLLLVLDELKGAEKQLLELRYILGPEWRASSEVTSGKIVRCVIQGPRRLSLECEAAGPLSLSIVPAEISREYGAFLPASCILIQTAVILPASVQTRVQWD